MTMTMTQTIVEERLQPVATVAPQSINTVTKPPLPSVLLRSTSFDRLKQFPSSLHAYFCRHGSAEILKWLILSRTRLHTTVSQLLLQLRSILLVASIYVVLGLLSIQLGMCVLALATVTIPLGLTFLLCCVLSMAVIAGRLNFKPNSKPHEPRRARASHTKQE